MALSEWLAAEGCTHIAMEAAGIYWKPVWHVLSDGDFELVLANAAHVKTVPGRKTDVNDAIWLADLMAHGLIRGSFVADEQTQEMRDFLRTRKQLVRERSSHIQRLQKTLEDANIKLDSAVSDIMGLSGRAVAASILTAAYHMLKDGTCYDDLGQDYFDQRAKAVQTNRLIVRLQNLGYTVEITPVAA